jgi:ADP-ribosyl-[dinitrogen reductase] hydrolase
MEQPKTPPLATAAIVGCLLGTAVGDAIGLPAEGLSSDRQRRLFGELDSYRLLPHRGMISDDTEHAAMVAQALIASAGDTQTFLKVLASELRLWTLLLPAGAGAATLRAGFKLLFGVSPERSGVYSAGNGPAMRAPLLGVCYGNAPDRLRSLIHASTRLTHTDPKAEYGAFAVALAAHQFTQGDLDAHRLSNDLRERFPHADTDALRELLDQLA